MSSLGKRLKERNTANIPTSRISPTTLFLLSAVDIRYRYLELRILLPIGMLNTTNLWPASRPM